MHRSWPILEPILAQLHARSIVYLGPGDGPMLQALVDHAQGGDTSLRTLDDARSPMESLPELAGDADVLVVDSARLEGQLDAVFALLDALSAPLPGGFPVCLVSGAAGGAPRAALDNFLHITSRDVALEELPGPDAIVVVAEREVATAVGRAAAARGAGDGDPRVLELEGQVALLDAVARQRERYAEVLESAFADQAEQLHATWSSPYWRLTKPLQRAVALARTARARLRRGSGVARVTVPLSSLDWTVEEAPDPVREPVRWTKVSEAAGRDDWRLEQDAPSRISYRVASSPSCTLSVRVGIRAGRWTESKAPAQARVRVLDAADRVLAEASAAIDPGRPPAHLHLDLGAGSPDCRLVLEALPREAGGARPTLAWEDAVIAVPVPAPPPPAVAPQVTDAGEPPPLISVVMPVHDPPVAFLERAIQSVLRQTYDRWQLCIADDGSRDPEVVELLRGHAAREPRISLVRRERGGGISSGTNAALEPATGEFVALLDHDDELEPDALEAAVACLREHPGTDVVYSDEDRLLPDGTRFGAMLKPGWSPELLRGGMYTCHLGVYRRALIEEVGGFRSEFDGAQDFDLMLRLVERTQRVRHVARVLYHWRASDASVAINPAAKPYAYDAGTRALQSHLDRCGIAGTAERTELPGLYRVVHRPDPGTTVSILLAGEEPPGWRAELAARTDRGNWDVVCAPTLDLAAREASGEYLVLLTEPCLPLDGRWLDVLLGHAALDGVGVVGAKVVRRDGAVQHAGLMIGEGLPLPVYRGVRADYVGYLGNLAVSCNYCAVAGALMTPRELFSALGGLGSERSPVAEADYCLRARDRGARTVFAPDARLELVAPRVAPVSLRELADFKRRWLPTLPRDPYFPNFWQGRGALPSPPPLAPLVAPAQAEDREQERREEDLDPHDDQRGREHGQALL